MACCWFLLPHPDDEFALSAPIADAVASGDRVECLFLTDGSFGGQSTAPRKRESLRVLKGLGVPDANVHFLGEQHGWRDGELCRQLEAVWEVLAGMVRSSAPDRLYCPAWEGGHQDHDAAHLIGLALARQCSALDARQYPLYTGAGLPGPLFRVLRVLPENGPAERRRLDMAERLKQLRIGCSYPSQWRTWMGLLPFLAWHLLADGSFRWQPLDPRRVLEAPHAGAPLYERRRFMTQAAFRAAAQAFIRERILDR